MNYLSNFFENIFSTLGNSLPNSLVVILILIVGWLVARLLKRIVTSIVKSTKIDKKIKETDLDIAKLLGKLTYFVTMVIVFMIALERLGMTSALSPITNMLDKFLGYIPNIIGAVLVGYIGYMLAKIISELVELSGDTIKSFAPKLNLPENINLVKVIKKIVFIFIFVPLLITSFQILNMDAISTPATAMLENFFEAIPKVLLAVIVLILFVVVGKFVSNLLKDLLKSLKLDKIAENANLSFADKVNLPSVISKIAYAFIIAFGLMTAVEKLEFTELTDILNTIITTAGNILFGLVILYIGLWLAKIASEHFAKGNANKFVGSIINIAIIAIFLAIGLKAMGIADDIINLAFGLTLGTVALTVVLSFGLGGKNAAGKQMERILNKFNNKSTEEDIK